MTPWEIQKAWVALLKKWVAYLKNEQEIKTWETQKSWAAFMKKKNNSWATNDNMRNSKGMSSLTIKKNRAWVALFKKVSRKQKHEKLKSHE